jgi:hypothetical protein
MPVFSVSLVTSRRIWPPKSPDLTSPDYYLRGHLKKSCIYKTSADTRPALLRPISAAAQPTVNHPQTIAEAAQSLLLRSEKCVV